MSDTTHIHEDDLIIDSDEHFTIDTTTRLISNGSNKKIKLMQYDNKSERYSFDIDRIIDGHDLMKCNRIQIHFLNKDGSNKKHPGLYRVNDAHINPSDENKFTFSWLISEDSTIYSGALSFLVSFECVDYDYIDEYGINTPKILYRWSTEIFNGIQVIAGMNNNNTVVKLYADELLAWQYEIETEVIPYLVDKCYIEREFATSDEVAAAFGLTNSGDYVPATEVPIDNVTVTKNSAGNIQAIGLMDGDTMISADQVATKTEIKSTQSYVDTAIQQAILDSWEGSY